MYFSTISSFFVLGLLGGFGHCVGMCNPFVLYIASRFGINTASSWFQRISPHLFYNLGRITTYVSLGLLCGILGKISTNLSQIQGGAALFAGIFLVLYALTGLIGSNLTKIIESNRLITLILQTVKNCRPGHPFFTGLALGLLPCGLVYSALAGAIALENPIAGGLAMASFGIGTAIAMTIAAFFSGFLVNRRGMLQKISMLFLLAMGLYFIITAL